MLKNSLLLQKTLIYKILTLSCYSLIWGVEIGIGVTSLSLVLYFAYEKLFSAIFKLRSTHEGRVIFMTGLPCSGKTTIALDLAKKLRKEGKQVEILDGDILRNGLCSDLGFSKEDREENLRRVGHLANHLARNGIIVICAFVAPYISDRRMMYSLIDKEIPIHRVFVDAPPSVCEDRDVKGMWAKARAGEIKDFTGVDDPFEIPKISSTDLRIRTNIETVDISSDRILSLIRDANAKAV